LPVVLYAVCRNCKIEEEGPPGEFFTQAPNINMPAEGEDVDGNDILSPICQGITIDDDNNPALENKDRTPTTNDNMYGEWGFDGLCPQGQKGLGK
jgi:hypothetical protein